jgi:hypothetical protein
MKSFCPALCAALLCIAQAMPVRAEDVSSTWEAAFPTRSAPQRVYFRAHYTDEFSRAHELQVWREGDVRLRRKTDDAIDLYLEKGGSGEYVYRLIDYHRKIVARAERTTLYRIGVFSDWAALAHVLKVPRGEYDVTVPPRSELPIRDDCRWKRLEASTPAASASDICWSPQWGLPLAIRTKGESRFSVDEVRTFERGPEAFVAPEGFLQIDADPDGDISD